MLGVTIRRLAVVLALLAPGVDWAQTSTGFSGPPSFNIASPINGQCLVWNSAVAFWQNATCGSGTSGTVTSVSVVTANGYSGTVATATTTPAITISGPAIPTAANPSASVGPTAVNGVASTFMASDSAPAINLAASYTWITGTHTFNGTISGTALSTYLASPPAIGGGTPAAGAFTTLTATTPVAVTSGGNGLSTATLGDVRYGSGTNTLAALAGNTTATKNFLTQTGNGTVSAAPAWGTIASGDLTTALVAPPAIGGTTPAAGSFTTINGNTVTTGTWTITGAAAKTLTFSNSLTLAGTDGVTLTGPATNASLAALNIAQSYTQTLTFAASSPQVFFAASSPQAIWDNTGQGTDLKNWDLSVSVGTFRIRTLNDARSTASNALAITRGSTITVSDVSIGNATDNNTVQLLGSGAKTLSGSVLMPGLASSSAATTGTLCWTTGTGNVNVDTTVACLASTGRVKKNVKPLDVGLPEVMALRPISYDLKDEYNPEHLGTMVGLIAEDVQKVDPRLVALDAQGDPRGVRYMQFTAVLVKAIQEQQHEIDQLKRQIKRRH